MSTRASRLTELPAPPPSAARLLELAGQEDVEVSALCREIELAPSIAARVVGVAGSAVFANGTAVRSVKDAVVRVLGLQLVCGLVTGLALAKVFPAAACTRFNPYRHWRRALQVAAFARHVARHVGLAKPRADGRSTAGAAGTAGEDTLNPDAAYLCGLLHNIGVLALVSLEPLRMDAIFEELERERAGGDSAPGGLRERARVAFGMEYDELGAIVVTRWHLAAEVACTIASSGDSGYRGPHWRVSEAVRLGRELADRLEGPGAGRSALSASEGLELDADTVDALTAEFRDTLAGIEDLVRVFTA